jgi:hypothetical protein
MKDFKPFLSWTYSDETLQVRQRIIDDLMRFILNGVVDRRDSPHPKAETFTNAVRSFMFAAYNGRTVIPKRHRPPEGDTFELVFNAFEQAHRFQGYENLACPQFSTDELCEAFCKRFDAEVQKIWEEAEPSVEGALRMAIMNKRQTESRLLSASALRILLQPSDYVTKDVDGLNDITATLWELRQKFALRQVMFAGLIGGDVARDSILELARDSCHQPDASEIQFAVIQYLYANERVPGSWMSEVEKNFRVDIANRYNKLKG